MSAASMGDSAKPKASSPERTLERLGKSRKEFGGAEGPQGGNGADVPTDPAVLQTRIQVLNTIRRPADQQTIATINFTEQNLNNLINGQPVQSPMELMRQMGGFGGPGRRNRGGNAAPGGE